MLQLLCVELIPCFVLSSYHNISLHMLVRSLESYRKQTRTMTMHLVLHLTAMSFTCHSQVLLLASHFNKCCNNLPLTSLLAFERHQNLIQCSNNSLVPSTEVPPSLIMKTHLVCTRISAALDLFWGCIRPGEQHGRTQGAGCCLKYS